MACGSRAGRAEMAELSSAVLAEEEALLPWSPNAPERFRLPSTEATSAPLVCHSGAPLQTSSQEKALRPTSSASTARRL